ncbi:TetR/AcrR family transcriptional regulator C-terminal domain-containing protein [Pseudonocardia sp. RS010]|uniref:TetR/AcrR family transcriptional regulator C-terminal domain-containing protein n=1 Tax=Pseudonocardia sp. RS010 TaxID=3385979 RepID=UPI0039A22716
MPSDRRAEIVQAAIGLLEETGIDGLSLRAVAGRVGVRLNTVSWHVKTKARLVELVADAILEEITFDDLPSPWRDRTCELLRRYRAALLAHRDGARVVAGTFSAEPATLRYAEHLMDALLTGDLDERTAGWTGWTLIYFTLGLVQEEQGSPGPVADQVAGMLDPAGHPALRRALPHLADDRFDDRFEHGLRLILSGVT